MAVLLDILPASFGAGHTLAYLFDPAFAGLVGKFGVAYRSPVHRHKVCLPLLKYLFRLGWVIDTADTADGQVYHFLDVRCQINRVAQQVVHGRNGQVAACADVQIVQLSGVGHHRGHYLHVLYRISARSELVSIEPDAHREVSAYSGTDGIDDLQGKLHPPLEAAAVLVGAVIGHR